jgi:hypothetical protein
MLWIYSLETWPRPIGGLQNISNKIRMQNFITIRGVDFLIFIYLYVPNHERYLAGSVCGLWYKFNVSPETGQIGQPIFLYTLIVV